MQSPLYGLPNSVVYTLFPHSDISFKQIFFLDSLQKKTTTTTNKNHTHTPNKNNNDNNKNQKHKKKLVSHLSLYNIHHSSSLICPHKLAV